MPTTADDMTFWQTIYDLRKRGIIPKHWSRGDIRPNLSPRFKQDTIITVPSNASISKDGSIESDSVKNGHGAAKAYRVGRGLFELINDPDRQSVIDRREILSAAGNLGLLPGTVEKDYVLGWRPAGIFNYPTIAEK